MTEEQIKRMVERFLCWKLPKDFTPDNGISYKQIIYGVNENAHWPSGTNLFDYTQANKMVRHMIDGLSSTLPEKGHVSCERCRYYNGADSTCRNGPPVRLPRKFDEDATAGNRVRKEDLIWGWPHVEPTGWCGVPLRENDLIPVRDEKKEGK